MWHLGLYSLLYYMEHSTTKYLMLGPPGPNHSHWRKPDMWFIRRKFCLLSIQLRWMTSQNPEKLVHILNILTQLVAFFVITMEINATNFQ